MNCKKGWQVSRDYNVHSLLITYTFLIRYLLLTSHQSLLITNLITHILTPVTDYSLTAYCSVHVMLTYLQLTAKLTCCASVAFFSPPHLFSPQ